MEAQPKSGPRTNALHPRTSAISGISTSTYGGKGLGKVCQGLGKGPAGGNRRGRERRDIPRPFPGAIESLDSCPEALVSGSPNGSPAQAWGFDCLLGNTVEPIRKSLYDWWLGEVTTPR